MTADIDDNIAGKLFGRTSKIRVRVNSEPLLPQLLAPFEWGAAVARSYCKKCGTVLDSILTKYPVEVQVRNKNGLRGTAILQYMSQKGVFVNGKR